MGPTIIAQRDRPVRVKFVNQLPTGAGGNLFIPVDKTNISTSIGAQPRGHRDRRKGQRAGASEHHHGGGHADHTPGRRDGGS